MKTILIVPMLAVALLNGCATSEPVQKYSESKSAFGRNPPLTRHDISEKQIFRVYEQGATGFVPMAMVRETAEKRAEESCTRQGKRMAVLGEQMSHPPYILGNFPRIELVFACIDQPNTARPSFQDEQYTKLSNLKKLLDDGVITKEEFERQKSKILSSY